MNEGVRGRRSVRLEGLDDEQFEELLAVLLRRKTMEGAQRLIEDRLRTATFKLNTATPKVKGPE